MANTSTTGSACPYCKGAKAVQGLAGQIQACPVCAGTGVDPKPGLTYIYRMPPFALTANQVNALQIITIVNWDFRWLELTGVSTGFYSVQFTDLGTQRQFSNIAIHSSEIVGDGKNPFIVLTPYVFSQRSQIQISLNDLSGAGNTVSLSFIGENIGEAA